MRDRAIASLLKSAEPSVRWKTRVRVLGENPRSRDIRALSEEIRESPRIRALLSLRGRFGRVGTARAVYYKWQGLHWVLAALAELGYPPGDKSLFPIRDRVVGFWTDPRYFREFQAKTRAQAYRPGWVPVLEGRHRRCASQQGNALRSVLALGIADERADALVERLRHWQWPDGGWNCDRDPAAHTSSFHETWLPMLGLAAYARENKNRAAARAADRAAEVFLGRRLFKRISDGRVMQPDIVALHYPHYWHYDILAGLMAMAELGKIRDPRCAAALDLLEEKRLPDGGWPAERRYYKVSPKALLANADYVNWGGTSRSKDERVGDRRCSCGLACCWSGARLTTTSHRGREPATRVRGWWESNPPRHKHETATCCRASGARGVRMDQRSLAAPDAAAVMRLVTARHITL